MYSKFNVYAKVSLFYLSCLFCVSFMLFYSLCTLHSTSTWKTRIDTKSKTHAWHNVSLSVSLCVSDFANVALLIISNACSSQCIICRLKYPVVYEFCFWCEFNFRAILSTTLRLSNTHKRVQQKIKLCVTNVNNDNNLQSNKLMIHLHFSITFRMLAQFV